MLEKAQRGGQVIVADQHRTVDALLDQGAQRLDFLDEAVAIGGDQQPAVVVLEPSLEAVDHRAEDRVVQCRYQRTDRPYVPGGQRPGRSVWHIAEALDRRLDLQAQSLADVRATIEHARNRRRGDAGLAGDILEQYAFDILVHESTLDRFAQRITGGRYAPATNTKVVLTARCLLTSFNSA